VGESFFKSFPGILAPFQISSSRTGRNRASDMGKKGKLVVHGTTAFLSQAVPRGEGFNRYYEGGHDK
jgi:hypothetical protein